MVRSARRGEKNTTFRANLTPDANGAPTPIRILTLEEMLHALLENEGTTPAASDLGRLLQVMKAAGWKMMPPAPDGSSSGSKEPPSALMGLTHGHPTGKLTGGVLATLIRTAIQGGTIPEGLDKARHYLKAAPGHHETLRAIEQAQALAASKLPPSEAIARMGEGWVAEEALAISIYCALVARDFREGIVLAVNHDGDSDSTGAITGNILGALWGEECLPPEWLETLELREVIMRIADELHGAR